MRARASLRARALLVTAGLSFAALFAAGGASADDFAVVLPGDSLGRLARRHLGDAARRAEIARLNDMAETAVLRAGARLRIAEGGARARLVLDPLNDAAGWTSQGENDATVRVRAEGGALRIDFDFKTGSWLQVKRDLPMPIPTQGVLKFRARGTGASNNLEVKIEDVDGVNLGRAYPGITAVAEWRGFEAPIRDLKYYWGGDGSFDHANLRCVYFAITKGAAGRGTVWIDDLVIEEEVLEAPPAQADFEYVTGDPDAARRAARWIASMQVPCGLVASYEGEEKPFAWTYDQALCLIVLAREDRAAADRLVEALRLLQKPEGYWNDGFLLDVKGEIEFSAEDSAKWPRSTVPGVLREFDNRWVGSAAWVVHALDRYRATTGDTRADEMIRRGAAWIAAEQAARPDGSCHEVTEGNLDCWWALRAGGFEPEAERLKAYLLGRVWRDAESRFLVAPTNPQPYLDCSTWAASLLAAWGDREKALRTLAFARKHFECPTFDRRIRGFDTTGPYTVWNEGTLQYVVAGGAGAAEYLRMMNGEQRADGAVQHSHEEITQGGAWHTVMWGVCPTAWLYFANVGNEPFPR